jgi:hypothetical protein
MSVEEIKRGIVSLSTAQQSEVSASLFHLHRAADAEYQQRVETRLSDRDPAHWLTPEEFEQKLDER